MGAPRGGHGGWANENLKVMCVRAPPHSVVPGQRGDADLSPAPS